MIFVDSNVLIDVLETTSRWSEWSREQMQDASETGAVVTSIVVLAETTARFDTLERQMDYLGDLGVRVRELDAKIARRAGMAHRAYRRAGGQRQAILADFFIGAHAETLGATLLTRDRQVFAGYFPKLSLITPETHP